MSEIPRKILEEDDICFLYEDVVSRGPSTKKDEDPYQGQTI